MSDKERDHVTVEALGDLFKAVETKPTKKGGTYSKFTLKVYQGKDRRTDKHVSQFVNCMCFGSEADCLDGIQPGRGRDDQTRVRIKGRQNTDDNDGKRYVTIFCDSVEVVSVAAESIKPAGGVRVPATQGRFSGVPPPTDDDLPFVFADPTAAMRGRE